MYIKRAVNAVGSQWRCCAEMLAWHFFRCWFWSNGSPGSVVFIYLLQQVAWKSNGGQLRFISVAHCMLNVAQQRCILCLILCLIIHSTSQSVYKHFRKINICINILIRIWSVYTFLADSFTLCENGIVCLSKSLFWFLLNARGVYCENNVAKFCREKRNPVDCWWTWKVAGNAARDN